VEAVMPGDRKVTSSNKNSEFLVEVEISALQFIELSIENCAC
jgi:hypothetical protein